MIQLSAPPYHLDEIGIERLFTVSRRGFGTLGIVVESDTGRYKPIGGKTWYSTVQQACRQLEKRHWPFWKRMVVFW